MAEPLKINIYFYVQDYTEPTAVLEDFETRYEFHDIFLSQWVILSFANGRLNCMMMISQKCQFTCENDKSGTIET